VLPQLFEPRLSGARLSERLIGCVGACICIAVTTFVCARLQLATTLPAIVAPLGASAVLMFAVPSSPLAQPWPVVGGNVISALVGVVALRLIPGDVVAAGVAVGAAILVMSLLRCLHPPGGAAALTAVIGGPAVHDAGFGFALAPVGINSILLVLLAVAFHRVTGRSYPHRPAVAPAARQAAAGFHAADIDAALADMHESFDISREDLAILLPERNSTLRSAREASEAGMSSADCLLDGIAVDCRTPAFPGRFSAAQGWEWWKADVSGKPTRRFGYSRSHASSALASASAASRES